ncbi:MAG TPA: endonuclease, partial [Burkholderiales bacterium]|nr:endonuclease [Burkholderiales bacterium]
GLLDPRVGRGFYHTFHARYPVLRYPLDHCFHTKHFRLVRFKRLRKFGSDHFPVSIELSHEPER